MKTTISAKVSPELVERLEEAKDDNESRSAAIARYIRAGLDAEQNPHTVTLPLVLLWFGSVSVATQYASASGIVGPAGIGFIIAGLALQNEDIARRVDAVHDRLTDRDGHSDASTE
jgi:hypothetical protein